VKKKISSVTLVSGIFPPDIGGPASFIPLLADKLSKRGIAVEVVTLAETIDIDDDYLYRVIRINRNITKPLRNIITIVKIIKSAIYSDLIFSNTLAFESSIASIVTRKKHVQKIVGDIAWERAIIGGRFLGTIDEYQINPVGVVSYLTNLYRNFSIYNSDLVITPSKYLEKIVLKSWKYKGDTSVIYNTVSSYNCNGDNKRIFRIISVARLIPHKGFENIITALSRLNFEFEYIVIGEGELLDSLINLSKKLSINAKFTGKLPKDEVMYWVCNSDIFILNSSYEGLPHVVLESMICKCPVIASNVGGTSEIIKDEHTGLLFKHNDVDGLITKIYKLYHDKPFVRMIINNAYAYSLELSNVDAMVDQYIVAFDKTLST